MYHQKWAPRLVSANGTFIWYIRCKYEEHHLQGSLFIQTSKVHSQRLRLHLTFSMGLDLSCMQLEIQIEKIIGKQESAYLLKVHVLKLRGKVMDSLQAFK